MSTVIPKSPRFHFIDLLRGWATIMMIETHTVNAYMDVSVRMQPWFAYLNFFNGWIAPSFIFISGFAFRIVTDRKWDSYLTWNPVSKKQLYRLLQILLLAYLMHLPFALLKDWKLSMPEGWGPLFRVDVLHIISLSLIALQLYVMIFKSQKRVVIAALLSGCFFIFFARIAWQYDFTQWIGEPLGNYFNSMHASLFPAFPWAAYTFFGYAGAHFFLMAHKSLREKEFIRNVALLSIAGIFIAYIFHAYPLSFLTANNIWISNPAWFLLRGSIVCFLLAAMWYYEKTFMTVGFSVVGMFGQNSLFVYVMHLSMIFGSFGLPKISISNYHHVSFGMSLATSALIFIVMLLLTYWWKQSRAEKKKQWKYFASAAAIWIVLALGWETAVDYLEPVEKITSRFINSVQNFF